MVPRYSLDWVRLWCATHDERAYHWGTLPTWTQVYLGLQHAWSIGVYSSALQYMHCHRTSRRRLAAGLNIQMHQAMHWNYRGVAALAT